MKKATIRQFSLFFIGLALFILSACTRSNGDSSIATATATVYGAVDAAMELIQQDMYLRLTEQFIDQTRVANDARMTATAQAADATATAQQERIEAEERAAEKTATYQVWEVTVQAARAEETATVEAEGTRQAMAFAQATETAEARATEDTVKATQDYAGWSAQATAQFAQAESAQLAANRERMTNGVIAWGPWIIALIALGVAAYIGITKSRVGTIERDANGMMPGVVLLHGKQKYFLSPDRLFSPSVVIDEKGITAPQLADPQHQEGATRRAQAVEAINALPPQQQRQGYNLMGQSFNNAQALPEIKIVDESQVQGWVNEAEEKL